MKIALIQQSAGTDIRKNIDKGIENVYSAAAAGAKIICFPELAFTPFYPQKRSDGNNLDLAEEIPGRITNEFSQIAKEKGIVIILNLYERVGDKTFDSTPIIDSNGKIANVVRMMHITQYEHFYEQDYYFPGDPEIKITGTEFGKIGIAICYDRHYPEYMRALGLAGAEIVFIPQAGAIGEWPEGLYEAEVRTAAFQNGYFTALCNRVGKEENLHFAGESFVSDPDGKIIARAASDKEEILYSEIDLDLVNNSYARKLFMRHRRKNIYGKWFEE